MKNTIGKVEKKIPDVSGLVKKRDYNAKISDIKGKYFTSSDYNKFMSEIADAKIKQTNLETNSDLNTVSQGAINNGENIEKL